MIGGERVLALIPARAGSKGLPGKNVMDLCGRPMLGWPVQAALGSRHVDRVVVSTDDAGFAAIARAQGAETPFLRPAELASDTARSADVVIHALDALAAAGDDFGYFVLLEPTSPLTEAADIDAALARLAGQRAVADAVVGISRVEVAHPDFDVLRDGAGLIRPAFAASFAVMGRRQELSELYFVEGSLYISAVPAFRARLGFYHERTLGHALPRWKSFEVDELVDLVCIEALMRNRDRLAAASGDGHG